MTRSDPAKACGLVLRGSVLEWIIKLAPICGHCVFRSPSAKRIAPRALIILKSGKSGAGRRPYCGIPPRNGPHAKVEMSEDQKFCVKIERPGNI